MIETIIKVYFIAMFSLIMLAIVLDIKNETTYRNHMIISKAIFKYNNDNPWVKWYSYDVMEDYDKTFRRFWDWGYTRIVPPEVFEKIKPYIER